MKKGAQYTESEWRALCDAMDKAETESSVNVNTPCCTWVVQTAGEEPTL